MHQDAVVYIIDDEIEVTDSLKWLIESMHYNVVAFNQVEEFLKLATFAQPSCLVLDIRMPNVSGLELQEILIEKGNLMPIIFITGHGDIPMAVRAMKVGAVDFLTKPVNNQTLLEAINKAIKHSIKLRDYQAKKAIVHRRLEQLTPREKEVMELVVQGLHTKSIADKLNISPNTVELHRAKMMKKMEARTVAELINLAMTRTTRPEMTCVEG